MRRPKQPLKLTLESRSLLTSNGRGCSSDVDRTNRCPANVKYLVLPMCLFFLTGLSVGQSPPQENHLHEAGTLAIFQRSAFVHGYRHGYEEGYHAGDMDVNMGRHPRTRLSEFHGLSLRYSSEFGPRKSFEAGFQEGLKAGYSDGFVGRKFRAVENLRFMASRLDQNPVPNDPTNAYFDQGVAEGYNQGRSEGRKDFEASGRLVIHLGGCGQFHPLKPQDLNALGSFCDGYRRGYMLGEADAVVLGPAPALSARK
jgi:hypothetical protein